MKKIIKIAFVAAFAAVAGYGVYTNQRTETMSDLMLANVEALASGEASVKDCVSADSDCILLHPTDPSKDETQSKAKWP
ncbi:NVEALA domain-containing protein [uncultured Bacteroides sp.]|uniref:NVEALA domain-containing protein n=1 Tax=uncultured Bacteroides sp. TaxID=162156 RepID=UPI0026759BE1|nr:NVEALA domain-containing protein [uncultured Bacteroides sp.]